MFILKTILSRSHSPLTRKVELAPRIGDGGARVSFGLFVSLFCRRIDLQEVAVVAAERAFHRVVDLFGTAKRKFTVKIVKRAS